MKNGSTLSLTEKQDRNSVFFESDSELKSQKAKKDAVISAGLPEDSVCVLIDTVSARYEMEDEQFFAEAKRLDD